MPAAELVRSMRSRVPWTVAGQILGKLGLPKSMGWRRTLDRVEAGELDYDSQVDELAEALQQHHLVGEKIVRFFRLDPEAMDDLRSRVAALEVPENEFSAAFPVVLDEGALATYRGHQPYLAAKLSYIDGDAIVIASARYLSAREALLPTELPDAAAQELSEFEEIICVRHKRLEGVDVLWVPASEDVVELRTDYPLGMHIRKGVAAADQAQARFGDLLGADIFGDHINLFPAIQGLYAAAGDGRMVELGFMVSGSAQKLERTRRDVECCREEAYHRGGVGALTNPIAPFRTSVMWEVALTPEINAEPEMTLRGHSVQTADPNAFLGEVIVRNAAGVDDYAYAAGRLIAQIAPT